MSILELYYEHYEENCKGAYWEEEKYIPYMVLIYDKELQEKFKVELINLGFSCVTWNYTYPGILVNLELKRFGKITKPCKHSCFDDYNYTYEEFCQVLLSNHYTIG